MAFEMVLLETIVLHLRVLTNDLLHGRFVYHRHFKAISWNPHNHHGWNAQSNCSSSNWYIGQTFEQTFVSNDLGFKGQDFWALQVPD